MCQGSMPGSYLLHLPGVLVGSWAEPGARPAQSFRVLCHHPGQQGFPHGVPGRAGVPPWHRHTLLLLVTGQRSHCSGPGGPPKAVPFPPGGHTPAVVPLQRLPHRARGQGERRGDTVATPWSHPGSPLTVPSPPQCEAVQFDMSWKVPAILYYARRNLNAKYNLVSECPAWKRRRGRRRRGTAELLPLFPAQSRTPSRPACCWPRPRWPASSASATPPSSPSC